MISRTPCSAHVAGSDVCKNGFPQSAACVVVDATPACCNEALCGRLYDHCGGKPPVWLVSQGEAASKQGGA